MAPTSMDVVTWLRDQLQETNADVLREMVGTFAQSLMSAEVDALCGAGYGERSPDRVTRATATERVSGTRARARSSWGSRGCARAATCRTGSCSPAGGRSGR